MEVHVDQAEVMNSMLAFEASMPDTPEAETLMEE